MDKKFEKKQEKALQEEREYNINLRKNTRQYGNPYPGMNQNVYCGEGHDSDEDVKKYNQQEEKLEKFRKGHQQNTYL